MVSLVFCSPQILTDKHYRYWWWLNQGPNTTVDTYDYHKSRYGEHVVYDDFIQNFTAAAWDPKEWVDLFSDAGANYFVQVSKHHEGFALFDLPEDVTKRTSVALSPHRNLIQVRASSINELQSLFQDTSPTE